MRKHDCVDQRASVFTHKCLVDDVDNCGLLSWFHLPRLPLSHVWDKFKFILRLLDQFSDLSNIESAFNFLDVVIFGNNTEAIVGDLLNIHAIGGVLGYISDCFKGLFVKIGQFLWIAYVGQLVRL